MESGLPSRAAMMQWEVKPYRPRLALDYLGQPQFGVSVGGYAGQGGLYGAVSGIFSDLLGHHTLMTAVQAQGQYDELGFQTIYLNQKHRWNWGAMAQRIPYIYLGQQIGCEGECPINGQTTVNLDFVRYRYFDTGLMGLAQYPFSPAWRVETSAGLRRISQDAVVDRLSGPGIVQGGQLVNFQPQTQDRFKDDRFSVGYNMAQASLALVYDNAVFGYTSPFAGQRYRFEISPVVGQLNFVQALADYRRYLFFRPFTIAVRGLHSGRYGRDDEVFSPQWMGYPYYMRGYYTAYEDCRNQSVDGCRLYQSMLGTRLAVLNAELRFPLIRALVIGPIGFPPIEGVAFYDAGVAWDRDTNPVFRRGTTDLAPGERGILSSTGVGARINLLGFAVLEVDYVKPLDAERDWHWQFAFQPGF
jgi:outer membrane protein assembly factor BamA